MNEDGTVMSSNEEMLHAYHDGELSGFARWRFERELRRSPALREELERLGTLRDMLRARDEAEPVPDLWDAIALRLPVQDAQRLEAAAEAGVALPAGGLLWWLKPVGAAMATAAVAGVAFYGGLFQEAPGPTGNVVRWIDSGPRSVMVLDDTPDTTIIWVLDGATEGAWIGGGREEV